MTSVILAVAQPRVGQLARELELEGIATTVVGDLSASLTGLLAGARALVVPAARAVLTADLIAACDRAGVRVLALGGSDSRLLTRFGLAEALPSDASGWQVAAALGSSPSPHGNSSAAPHRVTAVWGPHGSPGRSTVAILLAIELLRTGRRTALIDADSVSPSLSLLLGLGEDAPGIAAACRRAELGGLDSAELTRLATTLDSSAGSLDVLPGINRPNRWPELSAGRMTRALEACREWTEETVVDVSGAFDDDEEATFDVVGPRRHAATTAALREADNIVAVAAADPLGISRFVREHAELRRLTSPTRITVVVNQVRPGPLGIDARGQIRRTLDRFAGIDDVVFLPLDQRAADAALLHARPMASSMTGPPPAVASSDDSSRGSSRVSRLLRSGRAARGA
jgi:cellulose biosynthesis protein BcsQ